MNLEISRYFMERKGYLLEIEKIFRVQPVCALLGPRQVGKTTLAKAYSQGKKNILFLDLEDPTDLARLENPMLTLGHSEYSLIIIDEIQRRPDLFPILRVLVDREERKQKFLILGSASKELIRQSSESLAGRIGYLELMPFSLAEVTDMATLFLRGGFPRSFLAPDEEASYQWRKDYLRTFLERDLPALGIMIPSEQMRRFWLMLAHYHGQVFTASEIGKSLGLSDHLVKRYLDILVGTFMVRRLPAWYENLGKRQVKSPKIYFRDSGILHALLGLDSQEKLDSYPKLGSFWEGFALEEIIRLYGIAFDECYFWATHAGAELDLLFIRGEERLGFEFKYTDQPKITSSMQAALHDLHLNHLYLIYPGTHEFPLHEKITAKGLITM